MDGFVPKIVSFLTMYHQRENQANHLHPTTTLSDPNSGNRSNPHPNFDRVPNLQTIEKWNLHCSWIVPVATEDSVVAVDQVSVVVAFAASFQDWPQEKCLRLAVAFAAASVFASAVAAVAAVSSVAVTELVAAVVVAAAAFEKPVFFVAEADIVAVGEGLTAVLVEDFASSGVAVAAE